MNKGKIVHYVRFALVLSVQELQEVVCSIEKSGILLK